MAKTEIKNQDQSKKLSKSKTSDKGQKGLSRFRVVRYLQEMVGEVKKLTWLTKKELVSHTVAVFVFVIAMALIIYALDFVFSTGIGALESINIG
ncbi:MAG: preprotein translocase subunit SecE [Clostridia bacterium]|nr:preprotein translocase subunit SecE [Clostridia bacterium]MBQ5757442.1 preprotein translocase subunit SecE [Clostridia bacterium]MCR5072595.1 preprotein translocase subunit SecE [Clostridiales bacterium]